MKKLVCAVTVLAVSTAQAVTIFVAGRLDTHICGTRSERSPTLSMIDGHSARSRAVRPTLNPPGTRRARVEERRIDHGMVS